MKIVKRSIRYILSVVSKRVSKNHLFEQPQERERHPPVQLTRPERNDAVCLSSIESVSEDILGSKGFLLVHHWATWCDGCMEELDDIQRFVESLQEESIPTYAVSWELFNGTPPQNALPVVQHVHEAHKLTFSSHGRSQPVPAAGPQSGHLQRRGWFSVGFALEPSSGDKGPS